MLLPEVTAAPACLARRAGFPILLKALCMHFLLLAWLIQHLLPGTKVFQTSLVSAAREPQSHKKKLALGLLATVLVPATPPWCTQAGRLPTSAPLSENTPNAGHAPPLRTCRA